MHSSSLRLKELTIFAMLGSVMFVSQIAMQWIPNVHFLGLFVASFTLTYRARALIPIYVYVFLFGVFNGFSFWWVPYLYIWLPLWGMFMFVGKFDFPTKVKVPLYMLLCALHGLMFGLLYAPFQAVFFGLNFQGMVAWIIAGIPLDIVHGAGNFAAGSLIIPLSGLLCKLKQRQTLAESLR